MIHTVYSVKNNRPAAPRTLTHRQKNQALYCLKAGIVKELQTKLPRLGVHRITINRWLKQYSAGGREELLKIRQITGRPRLRAYYPKSSKKWVKYWCQDENRLGLKTIERRKNTAFGVKPRGKVQ